MSTPRVLDFKEGGKRKFFDRDKFEVKVFTDEPHCWIGLPRETVNLIDSL